MAGKNDLIKSKERVKKYGEVFTPEHIVKQMCDYLPLKEAWQTVVSTFLEPTCGNGAFLKEILTRKLNYCTTPLQGLCALESIYGADILPDNVEESKQALLDIFFGKFENSEEYVKIDYKALAKAITDRNIICADFLKFYKLLVDAEWDEAVKKYRVDEQPQTGTRLEDINA